MTSVDRQFELVYPAAHHLPSYTHALEQGWSPDNLRPEAGGEELEQIRRDPEGFIREQVDREAAGPPIDLPDGRQVPRLPGYHKWMWDGEFCGTIGFRWQPGTTDLPPTCLGHIGYAVVPWKRGNGYATRALAMLLPEAKAEGLPWVDLTTDEANAPSRRVIEANGGEVVEHFLKPAGYGGAPSVRYRITL
ncbi:MAG: GNAT family N-acetyltransferase [Gemmatimonadaceae bacterium]